MFHKSEILKNAVSERWCSDSSGFSVCVCVCVCVCGGLVLLKTMIVETR